MTRRKFRKKQCDNCKTELKESDHYCPGCGQENHVPNQPIKHLVLEVFESIFHFDTKIFLSLKYLFFFPGKMSKEFLENKRAKFVPPMRLYVFVSFIFFLILSVYSNNNSIANVRVKDTTENEMALATQEISDSIVKNKLSEDPKSEEDSLSIFKKEKNPSTDTFKLFNLIYVYTQEDLNALKESNLDHKELDSLIVKQNQSPNFLNRTVLKIFVLNKNNPKYLKKMLKVNMVKNSSILMFLLMPFLAFILYLLFIRHQKNYYEFLIFSVHNHTAMFSILTIWLIVRQIFDTDVFGLITFIVLILYSVLSLKNCFGQSYIKSILKFMLSSFIYLVLLFVGLLGSLIAGFIMI